MATTGPDASESAPDTPLTWDDTRDGATGRFGRGNPGRKPGSRNRRSSLVAQALRKHFAVNGAEFLDRICRGHPAVYARLLVLITPRPDTLDVEDEFDLLEAVEQAREAIMAQVKLPQPEPLKPLQRLTAPDLYRGEEREARRRTWILDKVRENPAARSELCQGRVFDRSELSAALRNPIGPILESVAVGPLAGGEALGLKAVAGAGVGGPDAVVCGESTVSRHTATPPGRRLITAPGGRLYWSDET